MKSGKSLMDLAAEIQRQSAVKKDYVADTRNLEMIADASPDRPTAGGEVKLVLRNGDSTVLEVGALAHRQIGERIGVPAKYYDRMLTEDPELLAYNVNRWFQRSPEKRMVRTLDGAARAFLSNRYQRIDNVQVADVVLPVLSEIPGIEIMSCDVTERRLYLKVVTHAIRGEIASRRVGDFVEAGIMISNSEVGLGAVSVTPFFHYLACLNGMVRNKDSLRSQHVGTAYDGDENLAHMLADDTRETVDRGILLKIRDVVKFALDRTKFDEALALMQAQTKQEVTGDPAKAIELLASDFGFSEVERGGVLRHLIQGGDLSRYGLMNAVTRTAEDLPDYDEATRFETLGGRLLDLPAANWKRIAEAA